MTIDLLPDARLPIVAAPMAGGPTTVGLARAVASAGGFPFLAAGYKTVDALAEEISGLRDVGTSFGVNLFVPSHDPIDDEAFRAYAARIQAEADVFGETLDTVPRTDDDGWGTKLDLLLSDPVPVVSFTFGLPRERDVAALRSRGTIVLATVTNESEGLAACDVGVDGLIVQGPDAGGHSAIFDGSRMPTPATTAEVVRRVAAAVDLPLIATGGVDGPEAVARLLDAGASAAAVGTLLLRTDEAGTSPTHRAALADPRYDRTVMTRAFTGRPARALRNGFIDRHDAAAPVGYPAVHHLTRALRRSAAAAGDADRLHLWAGTGFRSAPTGAAGDVIRRLAAAT